MIFRWSSTRGWTFAGQHVSFACLWTWWIFFIVSADGASQSPPESSWRELWFALICNVLQLFLLRWSFAVSWEVQAFISTRDCLFEYLAYLLQLSKALGIRYVFSSVSSLPCPALPASCAQCLWCSTAPAASSFLQAHHVVRRSRVPVLWHSQVLPASLLSLLDLGAQLPLVLPLDCWLLWPLPGQPWQQTWRTARPSSRATALPAMLVATTASWQRRSWRRMPWSLTASTMWVPSSPRSPTATAPCLPSATSSAQMTSRTVHGTWHFLQFDIE